MIFVMRKVFKLLVLTIIAFTCIIASCTRDNFDMDRLSGQVDYDGSFAIPLAYSDMKLYQILDVMDTSIALQDNEEGFLSMVYHSYVESKRVQELLNIDVPPFSTRINLSDMTSRGIRSGASLNYTAEDKISFTLTNDGTQNNEAEIDSIVLNSGVLEYNLESTLGNSMKVVVEFPSITKNGRPLKDSLTLNSSNTSEHRNLSLDGYTIDLTTTDRHFNEIPFKISTALEYEGMPPTSGYLSVSIGLRNFNYKGMYGYFGHNELLFQSDTIVVTMFKQNPKYDWEHARFYFKEPKITVSYWNSYGVPSMFYFTELDSYMQKSDQTWTMDDIAKPNFPLGPGNPCVVRHALIQGREAAGLIVVDSTNSYLDQIVPNRPTWLHFAAKAETNPGVGPDHSGSNFIDENSRLRAKVEVEIPLYGYLYNFTYRDTIDIDISSYVGGLPIKRMGLQMNINNYMPVMASAQFYLVDGNYYVLDSLIKDPSTDPMVLDAAPVDAYGHLIGDGVNKRTTLELTKSQIENLSNSKHMLIKITSSTAGNAAGGSNIKLFREYGFKVNIGVDVDLDVEANVNNMKSVNAK